jgi:hypothetical protein
MAAVLIVTGRNAGTPHSSLGSHTGRRPTLLDEDQSVAGLCHGVYPHGAYDCLRAFGLPAHAGGRSGPINSSSNAKEGGQTTLMTTGFTPDRETVYPPAP